MTVRELLEIVESWAPRGVAWEKDNVGMQCGDPELAIRGVLVALDATPGVVAETIRQKANVVLTHHPLLFRPLQRIELQTDQGQMIRSLLTAGVTLISAHTNLDFSEGGTSHRLAARIGLRNVEFLHQPYRTQKKIVTYVPASHVEAVAEAMANAGAGVIGEYDHCSFRLEGIGTFRGSENASPAIGTRGKYEHVPETRLEMLAHAWEVDRVIRALRMAHPYEEVAFEVYPTETPDRNFGMGVLGSLQRPVMLSAFLRRVKRSLGARHLRCTIDKDRQVQRIAVCGGSGAELLQEAIRRNAEVFVTADVKYHAFHDALGRIALVDAGHFETEHPVVEAVVARLKKEFSQRNVRIPIRASSTFTNPVRIV